MNFNPTTQMIEANSNGIQTARDTARQLISAARIAHDSIVFPFTNEDGSEVQYGAIMAIQNVRDTLIGSFNLLSSIDQWSQNYDFKDYQDYLRYSFKFANNRFISEDDWSKDFSHLDTELARLKELLNLD